MRLPWFDTVWAQFVANLREQRLPHALLIAGPAGLGKSVLATDFAKLTLCQHAGDVACGHCDACHWFTQDSHPDFMRVSPEEGKKNISIAQIRALTAQLAQTPHADNQTVIIHPAEAMNRSAANALLKTLEEPSGHVCILLVSDHPHALLPTIRSRCQLVRCRVPSPEVSLPWLRQQLDRPEQAEQLLALAEHLPMRAKALGGAAELALQSQVLKQFAELLVGQSHPCALVEKWVKLEPLKILGILSIILHDTVRVAIGTAESQLHWPEQANTLRQFASVMTLLQWLDFAQRCLDTQQLLRSNANPNVQLLLESLLLSLTRR